MRRLKTLFKAAYGQAWFDYIVSITAGVAGVVCIHCLAPTEEGMAFLLKFLPLAALPMAGFVTVAFHLRFRIIDTLQKLTLSVAEMAGFTRLFANCRTAINSSIYTFVLATLIISGGSLYCQFSGWVRNVAIAAAVAVFVLAFMKFLRILNVFGVLEDWTLKKLNEAAEERQSKK